jgi:hypothetical protein
VLQKNVNKYPHYGIVNNNNNNNNNNSYITSLHKTGKKTKNRRNMKSVYSEKHYIYYGREVKIYGALVSQAVTACPSCKGRLEAGQSVGKCRR